ncbi:MAG TPA: aromatic ring-hydroxylating dioxygenase subunit alpha [Kofleriaceae bacterium]|jgi:phenylpropionate dioxygenase-like ring-hydroxylating dioxygenase large terminal subunit
MQPAAARRLIDQLVAAGASSDAPYEAEAARYTSPAWFERERAAFERPRILAASSSIAPGACLPIGTTLLVRDAAGTLRAFANACRHRATRLVDAPCAAKALVCPYHGWTYDLAGTLVHVPNADSFAGCEAGRDLHARPVEERHGLVWSGTGVAAHLGEVDADLAALDLGSHVAWRASRTLRRCNWKLLVEAFLDGYHIRTLHRDSVYRFFVDAASLAERAGDHVRAITARRTLREAPRDAVPRDVVTPSLFVFPATTIIEHPDFVSIVTAHPRDHQHTEFEHVMLVPAARAADDEHWARSWELIEDRVFQGEDEWVCEQIQLGLDAGATDRLLFGGLEHGVRWFHETLAGYSTIAR